MAVFLSSLRRWNGGLRASAEWSPLGRIPQGLKPIIFSMLYAALKRRSSTVLLRAYCAGRDRNQGQ
jgi:hypothetical protein